jgi:hypothetical protein
MKTLLCLMALVSTFAFNAEASYPELFGSSFSTSSIGNQANLDANDPSNNYYAPSVLGFSKKFNVVLQTNSTVMNFKKIKNITVTNSTNSNSAATTGNANVDYPKFFGGAIHVAVPVGGTSHLGTLALSVFLPIGDLARTNSGDPFLPEYVMYHSRHQRTSTYLNFASKWSDTFSLSLGAVLGFQAAAEVRTNMSLNGANYGSWASSEAKVSPSAGVIASFTKLIDQTAMYFTYQQEMKSNLKTTVYGEITNPSLALINSTLSSMIFYDPHTFRFGAMTTFGIAELYAGLEYQMWSNYQPPTMRVERTAGAVVPSTNYEKIQIRDTINPRVGIKLNITDRWSTLVGAQYRMTPLKGDFSGSGNSIDADTIVGTGGFQYRIVIWSKDVSIGASLQYHHLLDKRVTKSPGQENGTAGNKLGGPGYDIGGYILAGSAGVKFNF